MSNPITAPDSSLEHPMPITSTINQLSAPVGVTLQRFIANEQRNYPQAKGDFTQLLADISLAAKIINRDINRAGLINLEGSAGAENIQGEDQQKLDVIANTRFARALRLGGKVCCIISEEEDELFHTGNEQAKYVIALQQAIYSKYMATTKALFQLVYQFVLILNMVLFDQAYVCLPMYDLDLCIFHVKMIH